MLKCPMSVLGPRMPVQRCSASRLPRVVGIAGATCAPAALGDTAKARVLNEKLVALDSAAREERTVSAEAKAFLAKN